MIQEIVMHTEKSDIPDGYFYDTETLNFYVYRHKYTGKEIHIAKIPPLYVNVKDYTSEVLDKIKAEIEQISETTDGFLMHDGTKRTVLQIIDKYKAESKTQKKGDKE